MVATVGLAAAKPPRTLERHPSWALCRWVAAAADRWLRAVRCSRLRRSHKATTLRPASSRGANVGPMELALAGQSGPSTDEEAST